MTFSGTTKQNGCTSVANLYTEVLERDNIHFKYCVPRSLKPHTNTVFSIMTSNVIIIIADIVHYAWKSISKPIIFKAGRLKIQYANIMLHIFNNYKCSQSKK